MITKLAAVPKGEPEVSLGDVLRVLLRLSDQLDRLPKAIAAASHAGKSITKADRECLSVLLPAISAAIGDVFFTCRDLMQHADRDSELQAALVQALGAADAGTSKRLGKLLARSDGFTEDGISIASCRKVRDGMLWQVQRLS